MGILSQHRVGVALRLGFFWWEVDIAYYVLKMMAWVGLIWDVRTVPESLLQPQSKGAMVGAESA